MRPLEFGWYLPTYGDTTADGLPEVQVAGWRRHGGGLSRDCRCERVRLLHLTRRWQGESGRGDFGCATLADPRDLPFCESRAGDP
jgi:hypothetical protein